MGRRAAGSRVRRGGVREDAGWLRGAIGSSPRKAPYRRRIYSRLGDSLIQTLICPAEMFGPRRSSVFKCASFLRHLVPPPPTGRRERRGATLSAAKLFVFTFVPGTTGSGLCARSSLALNGSVVTSGRSLPRDRIIVLASPCAKFSYISRRDRRARRNRGTFECPRCH